MLKALFIIVHVVVCLILVLVVLLQTGKRADLAGAFGGGGSQTVFGARGAATVLSKVTTGAAVLFMITSLGLSLISSSGTGSGGALDALPSPDQDPAAQEQTVPATEPPAEEPTESAVPAEPEAAAEGEDDGSSE